MATFFTSDIHVGHRKVASLRGFGDSDRSIRDHDQWIIDGWLRTVGVDDTVWVLGDLVGSNKKYRHALDILATLPGTKHLIAGNHDVVSPIFRNSGSYQREYLEVFESVQAYARINLTVQPSLVGGKVQQGVSAKRSALLSHYPYVGEGSDHTETPRYTQFRLPDEGLILLHGHTHNAIQGLHRAKTPNGKRENGTAHD